jgi:fluoroacetyl-CoA thioesterase
MSETPSTGLVGEASMIVGDADTAVAMGSGDLLVLASPRVAALSEEAAVAAVAMQIDAASTTVGTSLALDHLAPSAVGTAVTATARLDAVDGRALVFSIDVVSGDTVVARVRHERIIVDRDRFLRHPALRSDRSA